MATSQAAPVPRYVGVAFIAQFATSLAAGLLWKQMTSGDLTDVLATLGADATQVRLVIVLELFTSVGIIALTSLLYVALRDTIRWVATIAFALWLAEATVLAVSMLGLYGLLDITGAVAGSGTGVPPSPVAVGGLALGLRQHAADIAMFFFCAGALGWYWLFVRTRFVPRWLGIWGLAATLPVSVATLMLVWDHALQPPVLFYAAYVPFELAVGLWLLMMGSAGWPEAVNATGSEAG